MAASKYIVIEMQNGYVEGRAWPYDTREDAEVKWHQVLSEVVKSPVAVHTVMFVTDEGFEVEKPRVYKHSSEPIIEGVSE